MNVTVAGRRLGRRSTAAAFRWTLLVIALVVFAGPLILMLLTSLQEQRTIFTDPISIPDTVLWENYARAWDVGGIPRRALNSVIVTVASVGISTALSIGVAYATSRLRSRVVSGTIVGLFAIGLILPVQTGIVPLFIEMRALGFLGTLLPLVLINAALQMPLTVLLLDRFFRAVPRDIEEAAAIDGAGRWASLYYIIIPLSRGAIATAVILAMVVAWNDYFIALVFATKPDIQTLPIGLAAFNKFYSTDWPGSLAYSAVVALPALAVYIALQRQIIGGITAGAVK